MRVCVVNAPWAVDGREGIRAGCRFPNSTPKKSNRYVPFPFLLAYTASVLERAAHTVLLIDGCAERCSLESFWGRVADFAPDLVIAETSTTTLDYDLGVLAEIKRRSPGVRVAVFGSHTDARPQDALGDAVDYIIQGEPEGTAAALAAGSSETFDPTGVPGLAWLDASGAVRQSGRRAVIHDIDTLPRPKRADLPMSQYTVPGFPSPVAFVYAGRGCPHKCTFCLWPQTTLEGAFRPRAPEQVVDEIVEVLHDYPDTRSIFFDDDTFNLGRARMLSFADEMDRRGVHIPWGCNARADHLDEEVVRRLVSTGLFTMRFGIESGDQSILDRARKRLDLKEARPLLEMTDRLGVQNHIMFVIGLPGETDESVDRTIDFIKSVPCHSVQFSVAVPFPGTAFFREAEEKGHLMTRDWSKYSGFDHVVVRTDEMSDEDIGRALVRARRKIYFSPRFIRRRLSYIRDPRDVAALVRKAWRLLSSAAYDRVDGGRGPISGDTSDATGARTVARHSTRGKR